MGLGPKVFVRKNGNQRGGRLYKWSPDTTEKKPKKTQELPRYFCSTPIGSQGNDLISTYSYVIVVLTSGEATRTAYVQCDYVE